MKRLYYFLVLSIVLSIILAACQPKATPTAAVTETPPIIDTPTLVPASTQEQAATPTLEPVVLSGPEVAVGSTLRYVDGTLLVAVPAGSFTMGRKGGTDNPEHTVTISDFWIYSTKVTNRQYASCVKAGLCTPPDLGDDVGYIDYVRFDDPVTGVDWYQANDYCAYVLGRLPTEAEWEKAARGPDANIYPWGNDAPSCDLLNFNNCEGTNTSVTRYPQGQSYYQVLDMAGNAYEWVSDWYDGHFYKTGPSENPQGPKTGEKRSARSSGYKSTADSIPSSVRSLYSADEHGRDLGFRCVIEDPSYTAPACEQLSIYGPQPSGGAQSTQKNVPTICPTIGLDIALQKCGSDSTFVTLNTDMPALTTIGGVNNCTQLLGGADSYPQTYDCRSQTTATMNGVCTYSGLGEAYCADHYVLDTSTGYCKWDGSAGIGRECLAGTSFDSVNQCCSANPETIRDYPLCAVGSTLTDFGNGKYGCVTIADFKTVAPIITEIYMPAACQ